MFLLLSGDSHRATSAALLNERREQQELRVSTFPVDRGKQQLQLQAARLECEPVCLVDDHQGQRPTDLFLPAAAKHEVELLGRSDEDAKLPCCILVGQHAGFEPINLKRGAHLLDDAAEGDEIPSKAKRELIDECSGRREVRDPPALLIELVERLENAELRDERLAARRRKAHDDRAMTRAEQSLLAQSATLRGEHLEDRLLAIARSQRLHKSRYAAIHRPSYSPDAVVDQDSSGSSEQTSQRFALHQLATPGSADGAVKLRFKLFPHVVVTVHRSLSKINAENLAQPSRGGTR